MVFTAPDEEGGMKAINYNGVVPILVNAIKEQQAEINKLQKKIDLINNDKIQINDTNEEIKLLKEENEKLKQDIAYIKELLQSYNIKE